jgi:hypothetical protein
MYPFSYEDGGTIQVVDVQPLDNYLLLLTFSNGKIKIFDFKPNLDKPVFIPLKDKAFFAVARVKGGTVIWTEYLDIAPETLYWDSIQQNP